MANMRVHATTTFERTLEVALAFLTEKGAGPAAERLLDAALKRMPEVLARHPRLGRDFLSRSPQSAEADQTHRQATALLGKTTELREYILGDYIVLYAIEDDVIHLVSIRHHRQPSFSLPDSP